MGYGGKGLMDLILRYLLDVISLHEAQRPWQSESVWGGEREPTVMVMAKDDDTDKEFYFSYGFVESDEALEVSDKAIEGRLVRMVLKSGVINALVKKRRAEHIGDEDVWTRRRREYEQMRIQAGDRRRDKQPQEISKESLCLLGDFSQNERLEENVEVFYSVEETPGDGVKRTYSLPLLLHSKTHTETSEEQGGRRKEAKSVSVSATSSTGCSQRA